MLVFRVENEKKQGPYCGSRCGLLPGWARDNNPMPCNDGIKRIDIDKEVFGFETLDQLLEWFNKYELNILENNGFKISAYKIKRKFVKRGGKQVCFVQHRAIFMGTAT